MQKKMVNDYEQIVATLNHYIEGAVSGNSGDMKPGFHKDATIYGYFEGVGLLEGSIQILFDFVDNNMEPSESLQSRIDVLDIADTVATARITLDDWNGIYFTDFMTLLKVDNEWQIINKVFHHYTV